MNARRLHRGAMSIFIVLVTYWVVSGLLLAVFDFTDAGQSWAIEGGGPGARLHAADTATLPSLHTLRDGIAKAARRAAGMNPASIRLYMADAQPRVEFAPADGDRARMARFDALTGEPAAEYFGSVPTAVSGGATRESLKAWHKGNAIGLPGQALGILAGLAVVLLAASGMWVFIQVWRARARIGRRSLFWKAGTLWQRLHRGVAVVAAVFILNIAITGVILGVGEFQLRLFLDHQVGSPPYPRPGRMPPVSEGALQISIDQALDRLKPIVGAETIRSIEIVRRKGVDQARITFGAAALTREIDLAQGSSMGPALADERQVGKGYFADWHQIVKRMHRGDIIGHFSGRSLDIAAGLATAWLLLSGLSMYVKSRRTLSRPDRP